MRDLQYKLELIREGYIEPNNNDTLTEGLLDKFINTAYVVSNEHGLKSYSERTPPTFAYQSKKQAIAKYLQYEFNALNKEDKSTISSKYESQLNSEYSLYKLDSKAFQYSSKKYYLRSDKTSIKVLDEEKGTLKELCTKNGIDMEITDISSIIDLVISEAKYMYKELATVLKTDEFKEYKNKKAIYNYAILDFNEGLEDAKDGRYTSIIIGGWDLWEYNPNARNDNTKNEKFYSIINKLEKTLIDKLKHPDRFTIKTDGDWDDGFISLDYKDKK